MLVLSTNRQCTHMTCSQCIEQVCGMDLLQKLDVCILKKIVQELNTNIYEDRLSWTYIYLNEDSVFTFTH